MENTNIRINPLKYPTIRCSCGCSTFVPGYILKRIPGLEVGTGSEDQIIDLPVYMCSKCGEILKEYRDMFKLDEPETTENTDKQTITPLFKV